MQPSSKVSSVENSWPSIWTIGHSTRAEAEFDQIIAAHEIAVLVDVRSFPHSRRYPQFNKERLAASLPEVGVAYYHLPSLGGRRRLQPNSKNTVWKNRSFRAYADYMENEEFHTGILELLSLARDARTAIMCAEALWWRCHRSLISDYLKAHGSSVVHIIDAKHTEVHPYTSAARIIGGRLSYQEVLVEQPSLFKK